MPKYRIDLPEEDFIVEADAIIEMDGRLLIRRERETVGVVALWNYYIQEDDDE